VVSRPLGAPTREAFGQELVELGRAHPEIVVIDGDVNNSTYTNHFMKAFPDRFFNVGIAESNAIGIAAGLASCGKVTFVSSFACFLLNNAYEQLRMSIAYPQLNVKFVGTHAGISIGEDGPSQMAIEDVALASALAGVVVLVPADERSTRSAIRAAYEHRGPVYVRVGRPKAPVVYDDGVDVRIGKAIRLRDGSDITLAANGLLVAEALDAAEILAREGIEARVLDLVSTKPLDRDALRRAAAETGGVVVAEEHLRHGGLGSAVAQALAEERPVPMAFVSLEDRYAESGKPEELMAKYGLKAENIVIAAHRVVTRAGTKAGDRPARGSAARTPGAV
jgi:transketolase